MARLHAPNWMFRIQTLRHSAGPAGMLWVERSGTCWAGAALEPSWIVHGGSAIGPVGRALSKRSKDTEASPEDTHAAMMAAPPIA